MNISRQIVFLASVLAFCANSYAHEALNIISGGQWEASLNGIDGWIPAFAPYPNSFTVPNPNPSGTANGINEPAPGTTNAQLMWYWGAGAYTGVPTGRDGPTHAYFRYIFDFASTSIPACPQPGPVGAPIVPCGSPIGAWVAADDWMQLTVNGTVVGSPYILDDHMVNGQPQPVGMDFGSLLVQGTNTILIEAKDGCFSASCGNTGEGDRLFEYVFFDAQLTGGTPRPSFVSPAAAAPEPVSLALFIGGLGAMVITRRRSPKGRGLAPELENDFVA